MGEGAPVVLGDLVELLGRHLVCDVLFEMVVVRNWEVVRRPVTMRNGVLPRAVVVPDQPFRRHLIGVAVFIEDAFGSLLGLIGQSLMTSSAVSFGGFDVPMGCDLHQLVLLRFQ